MNPYSHGIKTTRHGAFAGGKFSRDGGCDKNLLLIDRSKAERSKNFDAHKFRDNL